MPGTKKCATHVDIARACMCKCALAVPVCVCDLLYVCVLTWEFARSLLWTRVNVSLDPDSVSDADSIFQTQRTNWKTKQTLPPRKCFICLPHTNKQQRTHTHTHTCEDVREIPPNALRFLLQIRFDGKGFSPILPQHFSVCTQTLRPPLVVII